MIVDESKMTLLGEGWMAPAGSLTDSNLARRLSAYKRTVAGNYHSVAPCLTLAKPGKKFSGNEKPSEAS